MQSISSTSDLHFYLSGYTPPPSIPTKPFLDWLSDNPRASHPEKVSAIRSIYGIGILQAKYFLVCIKP